MNESLMAFITIIVFFLGSVFACIGNDTGDCGEELGKIYRWIGGIAILACLIMTGILKLA